MELVERSLLSTRGAAGATWNSVTNGAGTAR